MWLITYWLYWITLIKIELGLCVDVIFNREKTSQRGQSLIYFAVPPFLNLEDWRLDGEDSNAGEDTYYIYQYYSSQTQWLLPTKAPFICYLAKYWYMLDIKKTNVKGTFL